MSHRVIEKRRRDRMNTYLGDLSKLIPSRFLKKPKGRVEKMEIIQMAIKYINQLQKFSTNDAVGKYFIQFLSLLIPSFSILLGNYVD